MSSNDAIVKGFDEEIDGNMAITLEKQGDNLVAHLNGRLDTANCAVFSNKMKKALESFTNIVIDCAALTYLSSAGVGSLAALLKKAKEKDGDVVLANVSSEVMELLKLLDFEQFFKIIDGIAPPPQKAVASPSAFPLVIKCPSCGKALKVSKEGRYRCPGCKAIISVSSLGEVSLG